MKKLLFILTSFILATSVLSKPYEIRQALVKTENKEYNKFLTLVQKILKEISSNEKFVIKADITNESETLKGFQSGQYDLLVCNSNYYYKNKELLKSNIENIYIAPESSEDYEQYYLIKNVNNKDDFFESKDIIINYPLIYESSKVWLETQLYKSRKSKLSKIIKKEIYYKKEGKIAYKIFFDKKAYGIITKNTYDLVVELNPQIKKQLVIIKKSEPIFYSILYIANKNIDHYKKDEYIDFMNDKDGFLGNTKNSTGIDLKTIKEVNKIDLKKIVTYYENYYKLKAKYENH